MKLAPNLANNPAEYEAILACLMIAIGENIKKLVLKSDSQLVVRQILGEYEARDENMATYLDKVKNLQKRIDVEFVLILREENQVADSLSHIFSPLQGSGGILGASIGYGYTPYRGSP
ncbi:RNase H family protein [Striga hermonthica]|uniref:RNase H family protein n=1 Tax=Striga hermonthica TaxID=68872 RepID=A0A9N7NVW1_STRHE|nr:RNase H family protein [Striga hermonthica]